MEVTEEKVIVEQEGFTEANGCVDKIFAIIMMVEEYLRKG